MWIYVVVPVFVAFVSSVIALIVGDYRLVTTLRRDHPQVWETLGRPNPWFTRFEDVATVHRFLQQRQYVSLCDPTLVRLGDRLRLLTMLACALAVLSLTLATIGRRMR